MTSIDQGLINWCKVMMLNDPDTIEMAAVLEACLGQIARCEQDLHAIRRAEIASDPTIAIDDWKGTELLRQVLKTDHESISKELEKSGIADSDLLEAPGLSVSGISAIIERIAEPIQPYSQEPAVIIRWLAGYIARAQLLDAWLEPAFNRDMSLNKAQAEFRDAFDLDGRLQLADGAFLLPRHRQSWRADVDDDNDADCLGIFARYIRGLAYIPSRLDSDNPDILKSIGEPISAGYLFWASPDFETKPLPENPMIAVAPLAERGSDVSFLPSACRSKYCLQLSYDETRFAEALADALEKGVHILLVPEMALPEGDQANFDDRMRQLFLDVRSDYFARSGHMGELRLVIAGVLGETRSDGYHRNYAVAFDSYGNQPDGFRQLKLSHWNLKRTEQDLFGITHYQAPHGDLSDPIYENSLPANGLTILEIPGVGRTAILICADMSQNNPGDWLSLNGVLDWLYAPIMDKSTCWEISDQQKTARPWIVQRSYRSALLTRTLVITTNSIALSRWVNEANRLRESTWPLYSKVGIGLAIDGRKYPPCHDHILVDIDEHGVLELFARPVSDWKPFPVPVS